MKMLLKTTMVLLVLGVAGMAQATTILVIDDFNVAMAVNPGNLSGVQATPILPTYPSNGWVMHPTGSTAPYLETGLDTAHVIGGSRLTTVTPSAGNGTSVTENTDAGRFSLNNDDGYSSLLNLLYNANGVVGGLGADLSLGDFIRLTGNLEHVSDGSSLGFRLVDADGTSAFKVMDWDPPYPNVYGTLNYDFQFDDFSSDIGGLIYGLDLHHIVSIEMTYQGDDSNDFHSVEGLTVEKVPEPISMMMLGCLGAGMAVARKLRRKA